MNKTLAVIGIILLGFVMLAGTGVMIFALNNGGTMLRSGTKTDLEQSFNANDVEQIEIDALEENVSIKTGNVKEIEVTYTSSNKKASEIVIIELQGDTLVIDRISNNPKNWFFTWGHINSEIKIIVPESFKAQYDIKTVSGEIDMQDVEIKGKELVLKSTSGRITAETTGEVNEVISKTTSGRIEVAADAKIASISSTSGKVVYTGNVDDFSSRTTSGNIKLTVLNQPSVITIKTVSGETTVQLPKNISGYKAKFNTASGDFSDELSDSECEGSVSTTYGDGKTEISLRSTSGNAEIIAD